MSNLATAWNVLSPTPVSKGSLIEPEATDHEAAQPWMHLPPGAVALFSSFAAAALVSSLQFGAAEVKREGLPLDLPVPALQPKPAARDSQAGWKRTAKRGKLHRSLHDDRSTQWSRAG